MKKILLLSSVLLFLPVATAKAETEDTPMKFNLEKIETKTDVNSLKLNKITFTSNLNKYVEENKKLSDSLKEKEAILDQKSTDLKEAKNKQEELKKAIEKEKATIKKEKDRKEKEKKDREEKNRKEKEEQEAREKAEKEVAAKKEVARSATGTTDRNLTTTQSGPLKFGDDGLLIMTPSAAAQNVINLELGIPGHSNGAAYHTSSGLDQAIDGLTTEEAVYAIYRMEGPGFGQTGAGYAGTDSPETHQAFVDQQVNGRFGGDIKLLLKMWGTYSYGGY